MRSARFDPRTAAAFAYVGLVFLLGVGFDRGSGPFRSTAYALVVACASAGVGLLIGRWWALLLPLVGAGAAAILGEPEGGGEVWAVLVLVFWSPFLIGLVLLGLVAGYVGRLTYRRRTSRV